MIIEQIFSLWVPADLEPSNYRHRLFRNLSSEDHLLQVGCGPKKSPQKNGQSWSHLSSACIGWYFLQLDHWIFRKWKYILVLRTILCETLGNQCEKIRDPSKENVPTRKNRTLDLLKQEGPQLTQLKALEAPPKKLLFLKTNMPTGISFLRGLYFRCKIFVSGRNLFS